MKRLFLIFALLLLPSLALAQPIPPPAWNGDVCLKMTGNRAQARAAIRVLGLVEEMLTRGPPASQVLVTANHDVAIDIWERPILVFGTFDQNGNEITPPVFADAPILRIRFVSATAKAKARTNIIDRPAMPAGLEKVDCPTTRVWM